MRRFFLGIVLGISSFTYSYNRLLNSDEASTLEAQKNNWHLYHLSKDQDTLKRLWQSAPKKGRGVTIVIIDTGVGACEGIQHPDLPRHPHVPACLRVPYAQTTSECIKSCATLLSPLGVNTTQLKFLVAEWIHEYAAHNKSPSLNRFIKQHALQSISGQLKTCIRTPCAKELLPLPDISDTDSTSTRISASHGTHLYGIIKSKKWGIAPLANVIMIKACNKHGSSNKRLLIEAVEIARHLRPDILLLPLKLDSNTDSRSPSIQYLNNLLRSFDYVIASSGNGGTHEHKKASMAYPASLSNVTFAVGAYGQDNKTGFLYIPSFSQYSADVHLGPTWLAPGVDILSTALPIKNKPNYLLLSGTSPAAAIITGCVALVIAEAKEKKLSKKEIVSLLKTSSYIPEQCNKALWQDQCALGAFDTQKALRSVRAAKKTLTRGGGRRGPQANGNERGRRKARPPHTNRKTRIYAT